MWRRSVFLHQCCTFGRNRPVYGNVMAISPYFGGTRGHWRWNDTCHVWPREEPGPLTSSYWKWLSSVTWRPLPCATIAYRRSIKLRQCLKREANVAHYTQTWCTNVHAILCHTRGVAHFCATVLHVSSEYLGKWQNISMLNAYISEIWDKSGA